MNIYWYHQSPFSFLILSHINISHCERKQMDKKQQQTDRPQLVGRRLDTLQGETLLEEQTHPKDARPKIQTTLPPRLEVKERKTPSPCRLAGGG